MKTSLEGINEQMVNNPYIQKIIPLDGTHYLHHTQSKTIALNINLLWKDKTTADETKKCLYANNLV